MDPRSIPYRLVTPRLVLRCWQPSDAQNLANTILANLDHLRPWMPWASEESATVEHCLPLIRRWRAEFDTDQDYLFGIFDRDGKQVFGGCGLHRRIGEGALEIGYWVDKDHTKQGLATETSAALTRVAFEFHDVKRVEIHCDPNNLASAAVPRKLGFTHEATLHARSLDYYGAPSDSMVWSLFEADYPGSIPAKAAVRVFNACDEPITKEER